MSKNLIYRYPDPVNHIRLLVISLILIMLNACATAPNEPAYQPSLSTLPTGQTSFKAYVDQTRDWLTFNRLFLTPDHDAELTANAPVEILPPLRLNPARGILLVHGLADSPYSFVDLAPALAQMGFQVRTVLLEGHGSRPADLIHADHQHWTNLVAEQVALFKPEVGQLYLGGFSTGGNLVTSYALQDPTIAGLLLFSPGFKAKTAVDRFTPLLSLFSDWVYAPSQASQTNYVRYLTAPNNGFAQFYHTSAELLQRLKKLRYNKPVFIALSAQDSVLDVERIALLFNTRMINPASRLVWYGPAPIIDDERVVVFADKVPEYRVSNYSHMGILFKPDNPYYGFHGSQRICQNGQDEPEYRSCLKKDPVWYSAWGYQEPGKAHARLTFNPQFAAMMTVIAQVLNGK